MSKYVKELITRELTATFKGVNSLVVVSTKGISGKEDNNFRRALFAKKIQLLVVKNSLAKRAFRQNGNTSVESLLDGPTAIAWGRDVEIKDVATEVMAWVKKLPKLEVRGGLVEGEKVDAEGVKTVASGPGRKEYVGRIMSLAIGGGGRISSMATGQASRLVGLIRDVEKKAAAAPAAEAAPAPAAP